MLINERRITLEKGQQSQPLTDLFDKEYECPFCEKVFYSKRVKTSKIRVKSIDSDFCTFYRGENPLYYYILVCTHCGYTYSERSIKISESKRDEIQQFLIENPMSLDFGEYRNHFLAMMVLDRVFVLGEILNERYILLGNYKLQLAWIYRLLKEEESEKECMDEALYYFHEAYEKDPHLVELAKILYILGELYRRLGDERKAVQYYSRIINDKKINDRAIIRKAREQWQNLRIKD